MSRILVNGGMTFLLADGADRQMNNYEFDRPHLLEIGIVLGIPDEVELVLSEFNGAEPKVIDNTTPEDECRIRFRVAHPNCSIAVRVKTGSPSAVYSGGYFYTISARD